MKININLQQFNLKQHGSLVLCGVLGLLLLSTVITSLWQWHDDWKLVQTDISSTQVLNAHDETADMIAAIPDNHLFGESLTKDGVVPISNLQFQLSGVVKIDNEQGGEISKAYISVGGQPAKIYQVGDTMPYGVKVYEILADTVILDNGGHLEKLPLPRETLQFKPREQV